jgi:NADH dehydrogenase
VETTDTIRITSITMFPEVAQERVVRVVVLGGGFAGLQAAHALERRALRHGRMEITLISREDHCLLTPLLFEVFSGVLAPNHAVNPVTHVLQSARFVQGEIQEVDFDGRAVMVKTRTGEDRRVPYDQLVIALGGVPNRAGITGAEHAFSFKTLEDATTLHDHVKVCMRRASRTTAPMRREAALSFVIVGGGYIGVELMGEMADFTQRLSRELGMSAQCPPRLVLISAADRLVPELDARLGRAALRTLTRKGVEIHFNTPVAAIEENGVRLPDGTWIPSETIVLAAGLGPHPMLKRFPLERNAKGKLRVANTLRTVKRPEVWALGDCAAVPLASGGDAPGLAQHAIRQAELLADNLVAQLNGWQPEGYRYETQALMASVGHESAIARFGPESLTPEFLTLNVSGRTAWWLRRGYYLWALPTTENRVGMLWDYARDNVLNPERAVGWLLGKRR